MSKIILIGAGGHCRSCIDVIESSSKFVIAGLIDNKKNIYNSFGYPILGNDKKLINLRKKINNAFITIGQIRTPVVRKKIFLKLLEYKYRLPVIKSKKSYISKKSNIDIGTIIMHNAVVNAYSKIGKNCILNTSSLVEHDAEISDHCHISTGAIINGNVSIGEGTFIGSGVIIKEGIKIGKGCVVGAGKILKKNLKDNEIIK